jgi:hypothetical protein
MEKVLEILDKENFLQFLITHHIYTNSLTYFEYL